jgi:RNA polymerase sigma factor (sigma-70 family)
VDDAELAWRAVTGDRAAWTEIYDRYADRLHDYCYSILRDQQESADALHEAFLTAATKIGRLRDPERLRPWLYAICRTQALAMGPPRLRELPSEDVADLAQQPTRGSAEARDLPRLVWDAAGGLAPKDRAVLDLYLRHGMGGQELGEVLDVRPHQAARRLSRVREHAERSLSALLVSRAGRRDCAHLNGLLVDWDGNPTPLPSKRVVRHIGSCGVCGESRKRIINPLSLLSGVPLLPAPPELRGPVLDGVEMRSSNQALAATGAGRGTENEGLLGTENRKERRWPAVVAGVFAAMIVIGVLVFVIFKSGQPLAGPPGPSSTPAVSSLAGPADQSSLASVIGSPPPTPAASSTTSTTADQSTSTRTTTTTTEQKDSQPPEISNVSADERQISFREGSTCGTTEATARVVDQSSLDVVLIWQTAGGDSIQRQMSPRPGNRFTATIGPVEAINDGPIRWWVIATDSGGSSSQSSQQSVQVVAAC